MRSNILLALIYMPPTWLVEMLQSQPEVATFYMVVVATAALAVFLVKNK